MAEIDLKKHLDNLSRASSIDMACAFALHAENYQEVIARLRESAALKDHVADEIERELLAS